MKHITCKQIGGPCDTVFEGTSSADIAKQAEAHITELAKTDPAHAKTYDEMAATATDPVRHQAWKEEFATLWEETPEVGAEAV